MRLGLRLGLVFAALLTLLLCGTLWLAYEDRRAASAADVDRRIFASLERLAAGCAASFERHDFERACGGLAAYLGATTFPAAFRKAVLVDGESRVVVDTDAPAGDPALGRFAWEPYVGPLANRTAPYRVRDVPTADGPVHAFAVPVAVARGRVGTWIAAFRADRLTGETAPAGWRFAQVAALGIGAGLAGSAALAWLLLAPLRRLGEAVRRVGAGRFGEQVPDTRRDELGELASEFNRMSARLGELDELKDAFMSQVTHDLRSPLSAMTTHAELVAGGYRGAVTEESRESLRVVIESGKSLSELINNILDVTQLEAGRLPLSPQPVDLQDQIDSVVKLLGVRAREYQVQLETYLYPDLREVHADPSALRRVLTNLVSNALKFTPAEGHVTVKAYRGGPNEVVVSVRDTGIGIPKERLGGIFAKFSQVPETKSKVRPVVGTGLGLAICKQLVEAQGGRIWVESDYGRGSVFSFTLPERPNVSP
ncbi:MAG: HAMP domain-containing histidine kinase [Elusimicrobia bacterium]|nr:HAMP domain-containing histidine kinase [Elusimicrobiota bacterium]